MTTSLDPFDPYGDHGIAPKPPCPETVARLERQRATFGLARELFVSTGGLTPLRPEQALRLAEDFLKTCRDYFADGGRVAGDKGRPSL